jgi:hypothetical protein
MTLKNPELSYFLSKRDRIIAILYAIRRLLPLKWIVAEKSLNRMFEAIPGYITHSVQDDIQTLGF